MSRLWPALADAGLVMLFATLGRRSHAHGVTVAGVLQTAWPFLVGAGAGWILAGLVTDQAARSLPFGVIVVVGAVVIGMGLRIATGTGSAWSFVAVATAVLAVLLLGWRLVARLVAD